MAKKYYKQNQIYAKKIEKYGTGLKALKWTSYRSAVRRYLEMIKDLDFANKSVLDVGCGTGNLLPYILSKSELVEYTGIDSIEKFIEEAQNRYPDFEFSVKDFDKEKFNTNYDIVFCCGALNSANLSLKQRLTFIKKMFDLASHAVVFNMAGNHPAPAVKDKSIAYQDSLIILEYCFKLSNKLILKNHYHPKDFTIVLFK